MQSIKYLIGNPGCGKTTIINKFNEDFFTANTFFHDVNNYKDYDNSKGLSQEEIHKAAVTKGFKYVEEAICCGKHVICENTFYGLIASMKHFRKFKNRGMFIEVYFVEPDLESELDRNGKREYPTPVNKFMDKAGYNSILTEVIQSGLVDYIQFIDMKTLSEKDSLYGDLQFHKAFETPQEIGTELSVNGWVLKDTNAIHYACTGAIAKMYHSPVHIVEPIGKIYKYGNIFYSQGIKVIQ